MDKQWQAELARLRDGAVANGQNHDLTYCADRDNQTVNVFMVHHHPDRHDPSDTYTIHITETLEWVSWGDTPREAVSSARIALHQRDALGVPLGQD